MRLVAIQPPFTTPYRSIAVTAYAEQVGWNRQLGPNAGEMKRW